MRPRIVMSLAVLALGTACASAPAFAKHAKHVTQVVIPLSYSNTGPWSAPLSPNGISAAASAFGGPGFNGPYGQTAQNGRTAYASTANYSNTGPSRAPLSPNGIGAAADAFGGPGYNGPYGQPVHVSPVTYSTLGPKGAPLSPNGIGAAADAFGGPGYMGQ
jgi:hypothetical protein